MDEDSGGKGDLDMENGFEFYGLIMVKGKMELETGKGTDSALVYGAPMTRNGGGSLSSKVWTGSDLHYSSCVMQRISTAAGLAGGGLQPIGARAWSEF